jgi:2-aminoadipate transaminase
MLAALSHEMPLDVTWNKPDGGMFLWARLPEGMNARALLPKAVEKNVAFVPGAAFYADHPDERCLRLSFVTVSVEQIKFGVAALAAAIRESRVPSHEVQHGEARARSAGPPQASEAPSGGSAGRVVTSVGAR